MAFYALSFKPGDRILTSRAEYASNVIAFVQVAGRAGAVMDVVDDEYGQVSVADLSRRRPRAPVDLADVEQRSRPFSSRRAARLDVAARPAASATGLANGRCRCDPAIDRCRGSESDVERRTFTDKAFRSAPSVLASRTSPCSAKPSSISARAGATSRVDPSSISAADSECKGRNASPSASRDTAAIARGGAPRSRRRSRRSSTDASAIPGSRAVSPLPTAAFAGVFERHLVRQDMSLLDERADQVADVVVEE